VKTIANWRRGANKPRRWELERVAEVLSLTRCAHCNGAGYTDPGIPSELLSIDVIEKQRLNEQRYRQRKRERLA
jgi:hypothetical protein